MKQFILLLLVSLATIAGYAQDTGQTSCAPYHKGRFSYIDSAGNTIMVKRKNKFQVETNQTTNVWINFRIKWKSDCEYELTQVGTNSRSAKKYNNTSSQVIISKPLGNDGYEYTCNCKDPNIPPKTGLMKKL